MLYVAVCIYGYHGYLNVQLKDDQVQSFRNATLYSGVHRFVTMVCPGVRLAEKAKSLSLSRLKTEVLNGRENDLKKIRCFQARQRFVRQGRGDLFADVLSSPRFSS